jgi:hypothetical protein
MAAAVLPRGQTQVTAAGPPRGINATCNFTATIVNEANASGASVAAGMVLASNLLSARARATVAPALQAEEKVSLSAGGSITVSALDEAGVTADVSMVASSGGAVIGVVSSPAPRGSQFVHLERRERRLPPADLEGEAAAPARRARKSIPPKNIKSKVSIAAAKLSIE